MKKAIFKKRLAKIQGAKTPEILQGIINNLQVQGFSTHAGTDYYAKDPEKVPVEFREEFLLGYAQQVLFYRFTA